MILIFNFSIFLDIVYFACVSSDYFRIFFEILEGLFYVSFRGALPFGIFTFSFYFKRKMKATIHGSNQ